VRLGFVIIACCTTVGLIIFCMGFVSCGAIRPTASGGRRNTSSSCILGVSGLVTGENGSVIGVNGFLKVIMGAQSGAAELDVSELIELFCVLVIFGAGGAVCTTVAPILTVEFNKSCLFIVGKNTNCETSRAPAKTASSIGINRFCLYFKVIIGLSKN
jgi:hypothetical protein